jgi:putative DNA primase/helicase
LTDMFADYVRHGFVLVPIPNGQKGPTGKGWNTRERCVTTVEQAAQLRGNVGLAHAYSSTCAIDFDDMEESLAWLTARGIDAKALLEAPDAVRISSGRPNRAKLIYRIPEPLRSLKISGGDDESRTILEFRCATSRGTTVQDVLPPSIHPDTKKPYEWQYNDELVADWTTLPTIPAKLLALWRSLVERSQFADSERPTMHTTPKAEAVRKLLADHDPDGPYDDWLKVGMALHHGYDGDIEGLDLWHEWSARGSKFESREDLESHWDSFRSAGDGPKVTMASLRKDKPAAPEDFDDLTAAPPSEAASSSAGDTEVGLDVPKVGTLPKAMHLCTDQANAQRIAHSFGGKLIACAGRFYSWTGTHWSALDGERAAQVFAMRLSAIVAREAKNARIEAERALKALPPEVLKAAAEQPKKNALAKQEAAAKAMALMAKADALEGWSTKCEMASTQSAAIALLRKTLTIDTSQLDRDPWALNCLSGTIDLRTGELRPHNPTDYITKLAPVEYDPQASYERFAAFVLEIMGDDKPRADFLQRWFGYCATGDVREQKLVCHVGAGANGKGTLLNAIQDVLGDYCGTAPPGLLTAANGSERHPTEIADLFGRRMVTAHENDAGAELREGFVKQATGGDRLKARWMRADFFEFAPTHKLQLLTNHKPQVRGQDFGIWRRILLVPYSLRFGTPQQLTERKADRLRDNSLGEALKVERRGILRWIVEGAVQWHLVGLAPPDSVLAAVDDYQRQQDRVGQFLEECCELGAEHWAPFSGLDGLYPAYQRWAKDSGCKQLSKPRFIDELARLVPFFSRQEKNIGKGSDRRKVHGATGLRLTAESADFDDLSVSTR